MRFYRDQVLPRVTEWLLDRPTIHALRVETAASLGGEIVEVGFGSGLNLPALPDEVERVRAIDPDRVGRKLAAERIAESSAAVDFAGLDGQKLPLADGSVDGALSTFTLCSIPDLDVALAEVGRVLRPGARFCFLEHGLSPVPRVARRQRWLNPVYSPLAGGCRLDLDAPARVEAAGFRILELDRIELGKKPGVATHLFRGIAQVA